MEASGQRPPTKADIDQILLDIFHEILEVGELNRAARPYGYTGEEVDEDWFGEDGDNSMGKPELARFEAKTLLQYNALNVAEPTVAERLRERGLARPENPTEYRQLLRGALISMAAAHDIEYDRENGRYYPAVHPLVAHQAASSVAPSTATSGAARKKLSEAFQAFAHDKMRQRTWTEKTGDQAAYALVLWCELMGDRPFAEINKSNAHEFRGKLCELPAMSGRGIYKEVKPTEAAEIRSKLEEQLRDKLPLVLRDGRTLSREEAERFAKPLGPKTVNRHLTYFSDFFGWKIERGVYGLDNPFKGTLFSKREVQRRAQRRKIWEPSTLNELFRSPQWTGSKSEYFRSKPGNVVYEDLRFWAPILSLYTGMREAEICGLLCKDVSFDDESSSWIVEVRAGKTENAARKIPLHRALIEIGILEFVRAVGRKSHKYLFLGNVDDADIPDEAQKLSKWFTNYRKSVGLYEPGRDFHALRHTFRTALSRSFKGDTLLARSLMGHSGKGEIDEVYFHGYRPADTIAAVGKLNFGVDVQHLSRKRQANRVFYIPDSTVRSGRDKRATGLAATG